MAFGGTYSPFAAQYQTPNFQQPQQFQSGQPQPTPQQQQFSPTQMGYGNSDPMALYSLFGLLGASQKSTFPYGKPPASSPDGAAPQVGVVKNAAPAASWGQNPNGSTGTPYTPPANEGQATKSGSPGYGAAPSVGSRPNPNGSTGTPYTQPPPNEGRPVAKPGYTPPPPSNTGPAPYAGGDPRYVNRAPPPTSGQQAYDQTYSYYMSPEYAAYYNSLAPSTRAYAHPPGDEALGRYLAEQSRSNYNAYGTTPPFGPPPPR